MDQEQMESFFKTVRDLYATYAKNTSILTVYHRQHGSLLTEQITNTEDYWVGVKVGDMDIDLNLWIDEHSGELNLTAYPLQIGVGGNLETVTGIYQQLKLEII